MKDYYIAWWNLENLFDVENSPDRSEKLKKILARELAGWNSKVLKTKIGQVCKIIGQMNGSKGPDVIGICEVENYRVLKLVTEGLQGLSHDYDIAHADTEDGRGIDVAFIYDRNKFNVIPGEIFSHPVMKRNATRDIFQVNMLTETGKKIVFIGNHWPSRKGGEYQSEPYRIITAETLSYWHERIVEIHGENTPVIVMGDFNDEPYCRSVVEYALSWRWMDNVLKAEKPKFYNLSWEMLGRRLGTFYFEKCPNVVDQIWVSGGFYSRKSKFKVKTVVEIFSPEEMVSKGYPPEAIPFGRPAAGYNPNGYSDHFPVYFIVEEK